ncbi:bud site selection protein 31 [Nematocida ausubeli]|uniref:Uncharacterized protein n=1 Tax=Nematocida ausubeli (strain ATCC PRA-371 / ERTm2) TaxID=1913371 RepID=A0A086J5H8_NEMA1|nr:uncharacterized protein NESG_00474 [Nematocida ausubeli]KAI5138579.1 bud site selection protein 31 [Nematocida ausubeli]KAI5151121.1 bud site selection protein 31 [Nematocida ausubeli]KAI5164623.1 bud site selection protein 31 [Nematocida ausubeli]KFG27396.1 hypothetical protein NESG_00474 [Nematocida ausubeli]
MEEFKKEIKRALSNRETQKREIRQAEILRIVRERTKYVYNQFKRQEITEKQMGEIARTEGAYFPLIKRWKESEEKGENRLICCLLCIRNGKRCICRRVPGIPCINCLCSGECMVKHGNTTDEHGK